MLRKPVEFQPTSSTPSTQFRPEGRLLLPDKVIYPLPPQLPDVPGIVYNPKLPGVMDKDYRVTPPGPDLLPDLALEGETPKGK